MDERLVYSPEELLSDPAVGEPLIAGGMRCHGGFDQDGRYHSPRTRVRSPAIEAWQRALRAQGADLLSIDRALIPPQYPNVEQSKLLLREGIREPMVRALTMISIVEGFGAVIRDLRVPPLAELFQEPIAGTALAHLDQGLFEAHARDEAGWGEHGGHKQMWEAARDLALENPSVPGDVLMRMTMGGGGGGRRREPLFPQLDELLSRMLAMMANVLVIECFAESTFAWGEAVLSDPEVSAKPQEASAMVRYIRADETPHVEYLRTALSEVRARTLKTSDGGVISGRTVVDGILHDLLSRLSRERPQQQRDQLSESLAAALKTSGNPSRVREEFESLRSQWTAPASTGFEPASAA